MITCIAIDMDGTLLASNHKISAENIQAIKLAQQQGISVVIATGRSYPEVYYILKEAGITCPVICINGAEIRSEAGEILSYHPLNIEEAKKAYGLLEQPHVYLEIFTNEGIYTANMKKGLTFFKSLSSKVDKPEEAEKIKAIVEERIKFVKETPNMTRLFEEVGVHLYKLLAFSSDPEELEKIGKEIEQLEGLAVSSSGLDNLEINSVQAQKGLALEAFTKEKGISLTDTMAIGDSYNDLSMFQRVGRAVAMGNATDKVKAASNVVTSSNEKSGVAKAIMEVVNT